MRLFVFLLLASATFGQINDSKLIIGRNTGYHIFDDGTQTRIFGFAKTLGESIKIPGPLIDIKQGDSVKIDFWNVSQGAPHTIHLHGLDVDQQNDGVGMLSFEVHHMEHGYYYFKAPHAGTYLYHCHVGSTVHLQAGMYGLLIVRPPNGSKLQTWENGETYDREFSFLTSEIDTTWHHDSILNHEHDTTGNNPMYVPKKFSPQYYLMNGLNGTQFDDPSNYFFTLKNEKVYLRLANIGYYGTRYLIPSDLNPRILASDGRPLPVPENSSTIEVLPGERYDVMINPGTKQFYGIELEHFNLNNGLTTSSQTLTIQTSTADLSEEKTNKMIYPNPSSTGVFYINNSSGEYFDILDVYGRKVYSGTEDQIDLSSEQNGIYFLNIAGEVYRLIKN